MSTEIPGSDVRILTAFSVNIHKRKKAFSLLNAWVWHKKKGPPFYLGTPHIGNVYSNLRNYSKTRK